MDIRKFLHTRKVVNIIYYIIVAIYLYYLNEFNRILLNDVSLNKTKEDNIILYYFKILAFDNKKSFWYLLGATILVAFILVLSWVEYTEIKNEDFQNIMLSIILIIINAIAVIKIFVALSNPILVALCVVIGFTIFTIFAHTN